MRRNHFEFEHHGRLLDAGDAWSLFTSAVRDHAPPARTITVSHAALLFDPRRVLAQIRAGPGCML